MRGLLGVLKVFNVSMQVWIPWVYAFVRIVCVSGTQHRSTTVCKTNANKYEKRN